MLVAVECWNLVVDPNAVSARRSLEQRALIAVQGLLRKRSDEKARNFVSIHHTKVRYLLVVCTIDTPLIGNSKASELNAPQD